MPLVSVVTPCYNLGQYLAENIESVNKLPKGMFEHIIEDDCSPSKETQDIIASLEKKGEQTILRNSPNQELANTLNNGIKAAKGKYIIVLSADDKLCADTVVEAVKILEENTEIDIVFGDAIKFGSEEGYQHSRRFNVQELIVDNYIHASALYRKEVWEKNGGYDAAAPYMGFEDWEFWINSYKNKFDFHYLPKPFIEYRILQDSKIRTLNKTRAKVNEVMEFIFNKHSEIASAQWLDDFIIYRIKQNKLAYLYKWILKAYFPNKFDSMCKSGKFRRYL
jgi:glycosyltransferase involved in cell wall biosynthesis